MIDRRSPPHGRDDLIADLRAIGVAPGDALLVHADLDAMGPLLGGARSVIEALLAAVGSGGLVLMPAFTSDALMPTTKTAATRPVLEAAVPGFDAARSAADRSGALAEAFRTWPETRRSSHPVYSLAALGAGAAEFLSPHPRDWALGPEGPMGRLLEHEAGKVLTVARAWSDHPALTMAETMALRRRLRVVRYKDIARRPARWLHARDVAADRGGAHPIVGAAFEAAAHEGRAGPLALARLGDAPASLCRLDDLVAFAAPCLARLNARTQDDPCRRTAPLRAPADTARHPPASWPCAPGERGESR
ncbi:MAG: AAC(3) family N-acetyltransferase [Paracoccaceae bacterium]